MSEIDAVTVMQLSPINAKLAQTVKKKKKKSLILTVSEDAESLERVNPFIERVNPFIAVMSLENNHYNTMVVFK